jgi:hypothetical protein
MEVWNMKQRQRLGIRDFRILSVSLAPFSNSEKCGREGWSGEGIIVDPLQIRLHLFNSNTENKNVCKSMTTTSTEATCTREKYNSYREHRNIFINEDLIHLRYADCD